MKTVLNIDGPLGLFFGQVWLENMAKPSGFLDRARGVKALKAALESDYSNVETRVAFCALVEHAEDKQERDDLIALMGISKGTFYSWKRDANQLIDGTLKVRTVVIRK
ncbi:hypothetical protein PYDG_00037 [Pseudoalteromonas phage pYD6-A]|uniref:Uncharacterized protein n=1 Tax=Pseudoalteromonas phage pYD6-A TaxID=754052 RepID=M4T3X0_9CAUD|nr:hypothetical protein PYDG_00037 [Pseudoalteromonas phage pYD6-A]AGH57569.1 hypothetical protein PYDG_00037 [Pseudoalteromonas phage pYD6-A]